VFWRAHFVGSAVFVEKKGCQAPRSFLSAQGEKIEDQRSNRRRVQCLTRDSSFARHNFTEKRSERRQLPQQLDIGTHCLKVTWVSWLVDDAYTRKRMRSAKIQGSAVFSSGGGKNCTREREASVVRQRKALLKSNITPKTQKNIKQFQSLNMTSFRSTIKEKKNNRQS
jgi:hypothetical protein